MKTEEEIKWREMSERNESGQGTVLLALCLMVIAAILLAAYCQSGLTIQHTWLP
jgi:hypothetical protein